MKRYKFSSCQKGAVLVITAFMLLPILILLGVSIDGAVGMLAQRKLQTAVDAAAQAGALVPKTQSTLVTSTVQTIFAANVGSLNNISSDSPAITINGNKITVSASIKVYTTFMQFGGVKSITYKATSKATFVPLIETAIAIDTSAASVSNGFLSAASNQLITFINNLSFSNLISITPFSTEVLLDVTTTSSSALMNHLSPTTDDESSNPAFYAISTNYTWNAQSYGNIYNYLYGNAFPTSTSYSPLPSNCPGGYPACAPTLFPNCCIALNKQGKCTQQSCSSLYTYVMSNRTAILPLTANISSLTSYLQSLASFTGGSDGLWGSLMVWAWRTIAPEWSDFFQTNSDTGSTTRDTGTYPSAYNSATKNLILIVYGNNYWNDPNTIGQYFTTGCGSANPQKWKMTAYGVFPMGTNYSFANDGSCDNYHYKPLDIMLGLNYTTGDFLANKSSSAYGNGVLTAITPKAANVCTNIKAQGINVFVITTQSSKKSDFFACATQSSYFYQTDGSASQIASALSSISQTIKTLATGP